MGRGRVRGGEENGLGGEGRDWEVVVVGGEEVEWREKDIRIGEEEVGEDLLPLQ